MASSKTSVIDKQTKALKRMFAHIGTGATEEDLSTKSVPSWKVLILDKRSQEIVAPLLNLTDLRDLGVTLHLNLHSQREVLPDVPAVYFIEPSKQNIDRLCRDFSEQLYDYYYFNFVYPIGRDLLEQLAQAAVESNVQAQICRVFDTYADFIALDHDLFVYKSRADNVSFYEINKAQVTDTEMESIINSVVDCLFSLFATMGTVPIIRCSRNDAAEAVSQRLTERMRECLRDPRANLFSAADGVSMLSFHRPLLVVLDRNIDLAAPLHHTWTYQALTDDLLDYHLNKVSILPAPAAEAAPNGAEAATKQPVIKPKKKVFELNPTKDLFWSKEKTRPFPDVATAVQEELEKYKTSESEVKRLKAQMGLGDIEADEAVWMLSETTSKLTSAVSSLPQLLERKKLIDTHTTLATEVLEIIKKRQLDTFFELEEKVMAKSSFTEQVQEMLQNSGSVEDKLRLFLIGYICAQHCPESQLKNYLSILDRLGCDINAYRYVKQWRKINSLNNPGLTTASTLLGGGGGGGASSSISSASSSALSALYAGGGIKTKEMFANLMSKGSQFVMEGVKNLALKSHNLPVTKLVDALMERKSTQQTDAMYYFDPKVLKTATTRGGGGGDHAGGENSLPPQNISKTPFQEAFVFVVGGGCYVEYHNLLDYCDSKNANIANVHQHRRVVYGCTEMMNAARFLSYLSALGGELSSTIGAAD